MTLETSGDRRVDILHVQKEETEVLNGRIYGTGAKNVQSETRLFQSHAGDSVIIFTILI